MPTTSTPSRPHVVRRWSDLELIEFHPHGRDFVILAHSTRLGGDYTRRCTKHGLREYLDSWGLVVTHDVTPGVATAVLDYAFNRLDVK